MESKPLNEFERCLIHDAWNSVYLKKYMEQDVREMDDEQLDVLEKLLTVLASLSECKDADCARGLIQKSGLRIEMQEYIEKLWSLETKEKTTDWSLNVVIGNSLCRRSLHPKIQMRIDGHPVEMSVEKFATLRYEVAHALRRMESYI